MFKNKSLIAEKALESSGSKGQTGLLTDRDDII